jgi:hypothetical protein
MKWTLTSKDTLVINGAQILDLGDKTVVDIEIPDTLVELTIAKNGNAIFASKKMGQKVRMSIRGLLGGDIHTQFVQTVNQWVANPPATLLWNGSFVKNLGDGLGNIKHVSFVLSGGLPEKLSGLLENVEGDTQQGFAIMPIIWAQATPVID